MICLTQAPHPKPQNFLMESLLLRAKRAQQLVQALGPAWLVRRAGYAFQLRSGWTRRKLPATAWTDQPLRDLLRDSALADPEIYLQHRKSQSPRFFFAAADQPRYAPLLAQWDENRNPLAEVERMVEGQFTYFSRTLGQAGFPPNWNANPFTGQQMPSNQHWSQIGDFGHGDIKIVWEPNRFGFAYTLVRAYWRTGDEKYAEQFWQLIEDWHSHNPPQQGVNWKCGQETSLRVMAWCFGFYGFMDSPATTATRVAALAQMIALSGERIAANLNYALSQRNNHGISEGVGLWTIGSLFPELRDAEEWRETGRRVLEAEGRKLIYDDGSFSQHSVNYHRLMLHDYLWAIRLGDLLQQPFSAALKERVARAGDWLYQIQDDVSGQAPCYGANDGALILPLNNCGYLDHRPVVGAITYLFTGQRGFERGPWDEDLLWLFGADALKAPVASSQRRDFKADQGGYYTLRGGNGFILTRSASFCDRPSHADLLHLDVWWRGQNIALDAGTFSYNPADPLESPFEKTEYHNTVSVDALDQMDKFSRFLWLPWARGKVRINRASSLEHLAYWEGEHDGYQRLPSGVLHRRGVLRLGEEHWIVLDALQGSSNHRYRLHWLLPDMPFAWDDAGQRLVLATPAGAYAVQICEMTNAGTASVVRADEKSARGWRSAYYGTREAAVSLDLAMEGTSALFWTLLGPEGSGVKMSSGALEIETANWQAQVHLDTSSTTKPILASATLSGTRHDELHLS